MRMKQHCGKKKKGVIECVYKQLNSRVKKARKMKIHEVAKKNNLGINQVTSILRRYRLNGHTLRHPKDPPAPR